MLTSLGKIEQPVSLFEHHRQSQDKAEVFFTFDFLPYYSPGSAIVTLFVLCKFDFRDSSKSGNDFTLAITDDKKLGNRIASHCSSSTFHELTKLLNLREIDLSQPHQLETVDIPKPWGKEIWYTGIEARGVCSINGTPLPWISAVYPGLFTAEPLSSIARNPAVGPADEPVLLKILSPKKEEVFGDLYFELHVEKIEVYVITHLDLEAWPSGVAEMRYGFNQSKLNEFDTRAQFTTAYLKAVSDYKSVRDSIDEIIETRRSEEGFESNQVLPIETIVNWQKQLSSEIIQQELTLRSVMEAYTATRKVVVGDVIEVERLTPHSLQHGITAIEFQSPHYERYILSFAQKVLTQNHWDTETAMELALLEPTPAKPLRTLPAAEGITVEIAADFDRFQVQRLTLEPGKQHQLKNNTYVLIIGLIGETSLKSEVILPEQAFYLAPTAEDMNLENSSSEVSKLLIAIPRAKS